jgi:hypothetical protein
MSNSISNMMNFANANSNSFQKKCRKYKSVYPNFNPLLGSLSITTSISGAYTVVKVYGENFLPMGNTYINFGPISNIPVTYYSSNTISFVVPIINNFGDTTYNVVAVNIYNGNFGFAPKYPSTGSLSYSNPLLYTLKANANQNPSPPDFGYGPFIYPYPPVDLSNNESKEEAKTFTYALTAYYNETLSVIYLNNIILALQDIITQANRASKALLAIQIAQAKITQAINQNVSANLYQTNLITALQEYNTAIQTANADIIYSQNIDLTATNTLIVVQQNIDWANTSANSAVGYATASSNPAKQLALATQQAANFLSINTGGILQSNLQTYLNNGLLEIIRTQINQYNAKSTAINTVNLYIDNIQQLINYLIVVEGWTNTVVIDASNAIIPLATRTSP